MLVVVLAMLALARSPKRASCGCASSGARSCSTAARSAPPARTKSSSARSTSASIPTLPRNGDIVDLKLAPRNARGEVEASADFYMLKPVDPRRGNGRLFYEVGNRGGKAMLATFQKATGSPDPTTEAEFGDGALMRQGFTLLWMGWQWDVPERAGHDAHGDADRDRERHAASPASCAATSS